MVRRELVEVNVTLHDDGSQPGMYDLHIVKSDGTEAAMEVTAAADQDSIELWNIVNGSGERWIVPELVGGWMASLLPTARAKRIKIELPELLADCEQMGVGELRAGRSRHPDPLTARAEDMGITHVSQGATAHPGVIYLTIEQPHNRTGGAASPAELLAWVPKFFAEPQQSDILTKLARSAATERHAFVFLPGFSTAPFGVTDLLWQVDSVLPTDPPILPPEVTHLWLVATWRVGTGVRWSVDSGWRRFDKAPG
jgi:hypothetical protein